MKLGQIRGGAILRHLNFKSIAISSTYQVKKSRSSQTTIKIDSFGSGQSLGRVLERSQKTWRNQQDNESARIDGFLLRSCRDIGRTVKEKEHR